MSVLGDEKVGNPERANENRVGKGGGKTASKKKEGSRRRENLKVEDQPPAPATSGGGGNQSPQEQKNTAPHRGGKNRNGKPMAARKVSTLLPSTCEGREPCLEEAWEEGNATPGDTKKTGGKRNLYGPKATPNCRM